MTRKTTSSGHSYVSVDGGDPLYHGDLVEWYDRLYYPAERTAREVECYQRLMLANGCQNFLEVAAGTGRISLPLVRAGYEGTLHDLSPDTLTFAALKGASEGLPVSTGVFDMRSCADFNGHFDCVLMVCSALLYMRTTDDAVAALSACRTQMKADGILIIDFTNYWGKLVAGRSASTLTEFESDGWRMRIESLATISSISGIAHARQTIARSRFGQSLPLIQRELAFRILNFLELQAHLIAAGLRIRELYGNFELDALSEKSCDRFLVVAARQHGN